MFTLIVPLLKAAAGKLGPLSFQQQPTQRRGRPGPAEDTRPPSVREQQYNIGGWGGGGGVVEGAGGLGGGGVEEERQ